MRSTALLALLPFLVNVATARPHQTGHDHSVHRSHRIRKSLAFGPTHSHASFELIDDAVVGQGLGTMDTIEVAKMFISERLNITEGEGFYLRGDVSHCLGRDFPCGASTTNWHTMVAKNVTNTEQTYTDVRTGITHVYARQLLNGLEVSDGDINLNIDRDGRVISWGNSFHPGSAPDVNSLPSGRSGETEKVCSILKESLALHDSELAALKSEAGPWGLVKSAAQVVLGASAGERRIEEHEIIKVQKNMRHINHHIHAMCSDVEISMNDRILSPVEALLTLLPRVSPKPPNMRPALSAEDFTITPQHSLTPKAAPAEPPTLLICGDGLATHGVLNDVPVRLMYTQTSEGAPRLVWKLEVEMKDNWYEAYVDSASGELLRILDWASDFTWGSPSKEKSDFDVHPPNRGGKQKPLPIPPTKLEPYTYQVFPWGES